MARLRKAYAVSIRGYSEPAIIHAPREGKAKGVCLYNLMDVGWGAKEALLAMSVRRSPSHDILLPDEHRLVSELSEEERGIVQHAYGKSGSNQIGYRSHYCTDPGDMRLLRLAWEFGLFSGPCGEKAYGETPYWSGAFFYLTGLGRDVARSMLPTYCGE